MSIYRHERCLFKWLVICVGLQNFPIWLSGGPVQHFDPAKVFQGEKPWRLKVLVQSPIFRVEMNDLGVPLVPLVLVAAFQLSGRYFLLSLFSLCPPAPAILKLDKSRNNKILRRVLP